MADKGSGARPQDDQMPPRGRDSGQDAGRDTDTHVRPMDDPTRGRQGDKLEKQIDERESSAD